MIPHDGISVAQLRVLRILAAHQPHFLVFIGTNTLRALIHTVVGNDLQREHLVAARLDMQELIGQGFLFREVDGQQHFEGVRRQAQCFRELPRFFLRKSQLFVR